MACDVSPVAMFFKLLTAGCNELKLSCNQSLFISSASTFPSPLKIPPIHFWKFIHNFFDQSRIEIFYYSERMRMKQIWESKCHRWWEWWDEIATGEVWAVLAAENLSFASPLSFPYDHGHNILMMYLNLYLYSYSIFVFSLYLYYIVQSP